MGSTDSNGIFTPDLDEEGWDPELATNFDLFSQNITDHVAHVADTADAHDASAISFSPTGTVAATDVQAAIAEVASEAAAAGAPGTADYLVGTTQAGLSAEIVVGATPGGELGGTWASPTVDATHSGSAHHAAATEGTGIDISGQAISVDLSEISSGGELGGTMDAPTVDATHSGSTHAATQAAAESTAASALTTHAGAADPHTTYQKESEKAAASGYASLDGSTKVPVAQLPTGTSSSTVALGDAAAGLITTHEGLTDPHTGYVLESLFDAKGDIITASADNTPSKLTVGADDTILMADASAGGGLKWVASASPSAVSTAAATGTADTFTRGDHVHGHEAAHTSHDTIWDAKGDLAVATGADAAAKLAVGTDFVDELISDASASTGVRWGFRRDPLRPSGAIAETYPRATALTSNVPGAGTSGTVLMDAIGLAAGVTITSITYVTGATALATGTHQIFGLYDSSLNLLRGTSDDTNVAWAANTAKTLTLTSTYLTTTSGLYYLGVLITATTMPNFVGIVKVGTAADNIAPILHATSSTSQTSLPNPAAALTAGATYRYAYVS